MIIGLRQNETASVLQFFRGLNETGDKRLLAFQLVVSRLENYGAKLFMTPFTIHFFYTFLNLLVTQLLTNISFQKFETKFCYASLF